MIILVEGSSVPVYTQERRTDTALYATGLPELSEFTIYMWYYGVPDDDSRADAWWIRFGPKMGYFDRKLYILELSTSKY